MALERTGQRELTELVTNHVLVDVHGNVLTAIVHSDREPDEIGQDRGTARPGLDWAFVFSGRGGLDLLEKVKIDKRSFLDRT